MKTLADITPKSTELKEACDISSKEFAATVYETIVELINNISKENNDKLHKMFQNAGIPYSPDIINDYVEYRKIMIILNLAEMFDQGFLQKYEI